MPISEKEKATLTQILAKMTSPMELIALAGSLYQTITETKLPSEHLMLLGKLIYARSQWSQIPNHLRFPFIRAGEDFFLKTFPDLFEISVQEGEAEEEITAAEAEALKGEPPPESAITEEDFPQAPEDELDEAPPKRSEGSNREKRRKREFPPGVKVETPKPLLPEVAKPLLPEASAESGEEVTEVADVYEAKSDPQPESVETQKALNGAASEGAA